ncbi:Serine/threonine-protein phosphatase 2A activator 1 [Candida viswanathii]|uniref:Serine/threonine-protein phosphatase 2A activator n=1 Tax=Candida viswanathii TaxID=5486 RepID=A0A367YKX6_9ASCO|nr:Serine/threonine-protein phosphatase 2A activator 1 [Candida viswanathii]
MSWTTPTKKINVPGDVARFKQSEACRKLQSGISEIVQLVQGLQVPAGGLDAAIVTRGDVPAQPKIELNGNCGKLVEIFDQLSRAIDETPPVHESSRFGNRAYREWLEKSDGIIERGLLQLEYAGDEGLAKEVGYYIFNSMGNSTRLDLGQVTN